MSRKETYTFPPRNSFLALARVNSLEGACSYLLSRVNECVFSVEILKEKKNLFFFESRESNNKKKIWCAKLGKIESLIESSSNAEETNTTNLLKIRLDVSFVIFVNVAKHPR